MSYRLITKASITITPATGEVITAAVDVRAYPSPKKVASGSLTLDGTSVDFKRTGGKGRGLLNRQYVYFPLGKESAYIEVTEAQATAITAGAVVAITTTPTPAPAAAEAPSNPEPVTTEAPAPEAPKAPRRARK
jgi:hypothetical protein